MSKVVIVTPVRYGSSRLPGKPLLDIVGKPMIQHVYERALQAAGVAEVWVAIDDQRAEKAVQAFGGKAIMMCNDHESGIDRLVEAMHKVETDICANLQGGEPMIRPWDVEMLLQGMCDDLALPVVMLCHATSAEEVTEPSIVKVVANTHQDAFYFSHSSIPYSRNAEKARYLKHVGIYAYRRDVLQNYNQSLESMQERAESPEQPRLMSAGINTRIFEVAATDPGVDTPACLEKVRALMTQELAENA